MKAHIQTQKPKIRKKNREKQREKTAQFQWLEVEKNKNPKVNW